MSHIIHEQKGYALFSNKNTKQLILFGGLYKYVLQVHVEYSYMSFKQLPWFETEHIRP